MQALHHHVAPLLVGHRDLAHALLGAFEREDRGDLDRGEGAVVVVALHPRQRRHQVAVADHEAHAPARHVVALGHREELDRDVARTGYLHDRRRAIAVEGDVGIGEVVHDIDFMATGDVDDLLEERQVDALAGRVRREVQDQHLRLRVRLLHRTVEFVEEIHPWRHPHMADVSAGDDRAVDVDRVAWIGHQHDVAALEGGERQVGNALFRPDGDDGLAVRIEFHPVPGLVPVADGLAQARNALGHRVAMGIRTLRGLDHLGDDVRRRRTVGVAHRQVDDVLAAAARGHLQFRRDVEHVRWQASDSREFFHLFSHLAPRRSVCGTSWKTVESTRGARQARGAAATRGRFRQRRQPPISPMQVRRRIRPSRSTRPPRCRPRPTASRCARRPRVRHTG